MKFVVEEIYNIIEAILISVFCLNYFESKIKKSKYIVFLITFCCLCLIINVITVLNLSWIPSLLISVIYLSAVLQFFYKGSLFEHLMLASITYISLALIDIFTFTILSKLIGVKYSELVIISNMSRFITVLIAKTIFFCFISLIINVKNKNAMYMTRSEYLFNISSIVLSGILISIIRNVIYNSGKNYNAFLLVVFCLILLNVGQYYIIVNINKKHISEKDISLMKKQLEMQESNIYLLEKRYNNIAKIQHDIKNYVSCALNMGEKGEYEQLLKYLRDFSDQHIVSITDYIKINNKVMSAVVNSKIGEAKQKGFDIKCTIINELDNISDIDIGILLANILDNAIEACEKNKHESQIYLKTWTEAAYYCIEVSNTVEKEILAENPSLITDKKDKELHGIGIRTIKDIVEKYDGMLTFNQINNNFIVCVFLCKDL